MGTALAKGFPSIFEDHPMGISPLFLWNEVSYCGPSWPESLSYIASSTLPSCVILGKRVNISVLQFPHLQRGVLITPSCQKRLQGPNNISK